MRRWLRFCNPELSKLITETLGSDDWTLDMSQLRGLEQHAKNPDFQKRWREVKQTKKQQLAKTIKAMTGDDVDTTAMFDVHVRPFWLFCFCISDPHVSQHRAKPGDKT
jgi:starch phosphorylase